METSAMSEVHFKHINDRRLALLKTLIQETSRATEACDAWLSSGHIADHRAWQRHVKDLEEADSRYSDFHLAAVS
jgi:hypothetical protein